MKLTAQKFGENVVIMLPDEFAARLGWRSGDVLEGQIVDDRLEIARTQTFHDRAMQLARRGMAKYRKALEALAKA
jgi:bifunctional DNA-binding transcriptional regulator/antitoxin component of YhaV-PrlF toxin-antitoxin module